MCIKDRLHQKKKRKKKEKEKRNYTIKLTGSNKSLETAISAAKF
jgi:hypothetical protein